MKDHDIIPIRRDAPSDGPATAIDQPVAIHLSRRRSAAATDKTFAAGPDVIHSGRWKRSS